MYMQLKYPDVEIYRLLISLMKSENLYFLYSVHHFPHLPHFQVKITKRTETKAIIVLLSSIFVL